ncbi:hypothetical protein ACA910_004917 [Epithemia clementina (nom. ined.)]
MAFKRMILPQICLLSMIVQVLVITLILRIGGGAAAPFRARPFDLSVTDTATNNNDGRPYWLAFRHGSFLKQNASMHSHDRIAANSLQESLTRLNSSPVFPLTGLDHKHVASIKQVLAKQQLAKQLRQRIRADHPPEPIRKGSLAYALRVGLAGGLAGAAGTAALFPMDTAKTLRQTKPSTYKNVMSALGGLCYSNGRWHIGRVYRGVIPSTLGAIPSSALYFGAYESMKAIIRQTTNADPPSTARGRLLVHSLSAASGNILSSSIFVPKEAIKQQMQYLGNANILQAATALCKSRGIRGMYSGYRATLLRNIPTAALRFTLYEELKHNWLKRSSADDQAHPKMFDWGIFVAGAVAGVAASAFMTPIDVIKTRISTGTCPINMRSCFHQVVRDTGIGALYAGAGSRMLSSGAFSAIGFGVLEAAKKWLRVSDDMVLHNPQMKGLLVSNSTASVVNEHLMSWRQAIMERACIDALIEKTPKPVNTTLSNIFSR